MAGSRSWSRSSTSRPPHRGGPSLQAIAGHRVTFRIGPTVERETFAELDDALIAIEAKLRSMGGGTRRETRSFLGREFAPGEQVAVRAELKGPRGLRAGVDLRGDGSAEAWTGRLSKRLVEPQPGEDVHAALRRAVNRPG